MKREGSDLARFGVDAPHHDDVGALPEVLTAEKEGCVRRVGVDAGVVVGARQKEVARFRVGEPGVGFDRVDLFNADRSRIDGPTVGGCAVPVAVGLVETRGLLGGWSGVDDDKLTLGERPPSSGQDGG